MGIKNRAICVENVLNSAEGGSFSAEVTRRQANGSREEERREGCCQSD